MPASPILTLEPLIDAVRTGVESLGWELSGLQKTTSHQFEGRWEGESTRSAYLFFHSIDGPEWASVDVYLDETGRGVAGNLALVTDLEAMGRLGSARPLMSTLAAVADRYLDSRHRRPLTLRFRLADAADAVESAETEVRFKVRIPGRVLAEGASAVETFTVEARIPGRVLAEGASAVETFTVEAIRAFEGMLASPDLVERTLEEPGEE